MHTKDARLNGETEQRIYLSMPGGKRHFTTEERAALALTEAVTLIATSSVSDDRRSELFYSGW